jgi:hypothetical protein
MEGLRRRTHVRRLASVESGVRSLPDVAVVSAAVLAADRSLPLAEPLAELLGRPANVGLPRGQVIACTGGASTSLAFALAVRAVEEGAWLAVIDVAWLGVEAVAGLGVPLERIVHVSLHPSTDHLDSPDARRDSLKVIGRRWAEIVAATIDGFELVITRPPLGVTTSAVRALRPRLQQRGAVLVTIGRHDACSPDIELRGASPVWEQVSAGAGHLAARRVQVEASGRRLPRARRGALWLPGPTGAAESVGDLTGLEMTGLDQKIGLDQTIEQVAG